MASGEISIKDVLPIPDNLGLVTGEAEEDEAHSIRQEPTASHSLAVADHDEKGHAQQSHDKEVKNLGWHEPGHQMPDPLVGGLANEQLWILIRRFNMQMYHVKETTSAAPGSLDLNVADEEEFSPDKLRACIERLYMTVIIGLVTFGKHIARLRSWRERRRTAAFCAAYFIAWLFDFLVPTFTLTAIVLVVYPPSRAVLFPPAPVALVDTKTGGVQTPKAGVLGSTDSATGAPENFKGEAVEAEASNFVNSIASVALASASGKHPQDAPEDEDDGEDVGPNSIVPDPTQMAQGASVARANATGAHASSPRDKTKVPMETALWNKLRPIMHGISDVCDTYERLGNALSPTPPFPKELYRLRLAAVIVPMLAASMFITSYVLVKGTAFGIGFGFFGDPVIQPALRLLNTNFPHWQKLLELRNTLLKGVPTNAQLTITLLRVGEANKAPLPPPPRADQPPPDEPVSLSEEELSAIGEDKPLDADEKELRAAIAHDPNIAHQSTGTDIETSKQTSHGKKGRHVLGVIKGSVKGTIETALGADHLKAKAGSEVSKRRLGVIPGDLAKHLSGPVDFKCRYSGKRGHAYISTRATIPCVSFSLDKSINTQGTLNRGDDELHPVWSVAAADIRELKKVGGLGWKAKLVVGWALNREVADGLEITDRMGNRYMLTAMVLRNELFNRLVAMGGQKWEAW